MVLRNLIGCRANFKEEALDGLRLSKEASVTLGIGFAVGNVTLASAAAITLLNRIEYAVFAVVNFLTEVPPPLGVVAVFRCCRTPAVTQVDPSRNPR